MLELTTVARLPDFTKIHGRLDSDNVVTKAVSSFSALAIRFLTEVDLSCNNLARTSAFSSSFSAKDASGCLSPLTNSSVTTAHFAESPNADFFKQQARAQGAGLHSA